MSAISPAAWRSPTAASIDRRPSRDSLPAVQVGGTRAQGLGALVLLIAFAFTALVFASTARAADPDASTRVAPGVYLAEASGLQDESSSDRTAASGASPRIVGGHPIPITQAPWQAAVTLNPAVFQGNGFDNQFCGGSLVAPRLIVTAAHCMFDPRTNGFWAVSDLAAITGRTTLSSNEGEWISVSDYFLFTDSQGNLLFNGQSSAWDIALIQLASPSSSPTIKIAGPDERELWAPGRRTEVTGWGAIRFEGPGSDALLAAELAMFPDSYCRRATPGFDRVTSICAGNYTGERDSCQGDSGGPLVAPSDAGMRLVGNVQSGFECARPRNPASYGRLGGDPVLTALRNAGFQIAGVDIYGSGARPPRNLTPNQALDLALLHAEDLCFSDRACRQWNARQCRPRAGGFRCLVENFFKTRRVGKFRCLRKFLWTAASGRIERENAGPEKCKPGW
jgi:hypothetical protein